MSTNHNMFLSPNLIPEKALVVKKKKSCKKCSHDGCTNNAKSRGLCKRHGGGMRCQAKGCGTSARPGGYCISHGGGLCKIQGCTTGARSGGLCLMHQRISQMKEKRAAKLIGCGNIGAREQSLPKSIPIASIDPKNDFNMFHESSSVLSDYSSSCSTLDQSTPEPMDFYEFLEPFPFNMKTEQNRIESGLCSSWLNQEDLSYNSAAMFDAYGLLEIPQHFSDSTQHQESIFDDIQTFNRSLPQSKIYDSDNYTIDDSFLSSSSLMYNNMMFRPTDRWDRIKLEL